MTVTDDIQEEYNNFRGDKMSSILKPEDFSLIYPKKKECSDYNIVMIFGGAAEIKSRILLKISDALMNKGEDTESFVSKFDSNILCAVKTTDRNIIIADGNYFTRICLYYPSVCEKTFGLDSYLSGDILKKYKSDLLSNMNKSESFILRAKKFENAAVAVKSDLKRLVLPYIDREKISNYTVRFLNKNGLSPSHEKKLEKIRSISCVSSWGIYADFSPFKGLERTYLINDNTGLLSEFLLKAISFAACECGCECTSYLCGLTGDVEHLIIPELSIGFFTENKNHRYPYENEIAVSTGRFLSACNNEDFKEQKVMNEKLLSDFLDEAVFSIYEAAHLDSQNNAIFDLAFSDNSLNACINDLLHLI